MVTGSRSLSDLPHWQVIKARLYTVLDGLDVSYLVHGGADGPDNWSHQWGLINMDPSHIDRVRPKPSPDRTYAQALYDRNLTMLDKKPDTVVAVYDGTSKGTKHAMDAAIERGIPLISVAIGA